MAENKISKKRALLKFKKLHESAKLPQYQTSGAAGFDFYSTEEVKIQPGTVTLVPTGLSVEIPEGYELQVRCRSGLAVKHGIFLVNGVGTIDSDYRGEIKIIMSTCRNDTVTLAAGERVAQGVLAQYESAEISEVEELSDTARGIGGFGSTGRG